MPRQVVISWSGGKDSAWTLQVLRQRPQEFTVVGLLTTVNLQFRRVAIHGVRRELLHAQAKAVGLPLWTVPLPFPCRNEDYERGMIRAIRFLAAIGVDVLAFGDLFLQDIRQYREQRFSDAGLDLMFPLWERPTTVLAHEMIASGMKAKIVCVDPKQVPSDVAGREYDESLLTELPAGVDPCAENGEFHTFVYAGPMFREPLSVTTGEFVQRDGLVFVDLQATRSVNLPWAAENV
jgi:uncharacterized protein (TIGR00290 family)